MYNVYTCTIVQIFNHEYEIILVSSFMVVVYFVFVIILFYDVKNITDNVNHNANIFMHLYHMYQLCSYFIIQGFVIIMSLLAA